MVVGRSLMNRDTQTMPQRSIPAIAALGVPAVLVGVAVAQSDLRQGKEAFGSWQADKPGAIRLIKPQDLPAPGATRSAANMSRVVPKPARAAPLVPDGFKIKLFAEGLSGPRTIRVAPNSDIFVAETQAGRIRVFRAADGASTPATSEVYASGLHEPFGSLAEGGEAAVGVHPELAGLRITGEERRLRGIHADDEGARGFGVLDLRAESAGEERFVAGGDGAAGAGVKPVVGDDAMLRGPCAGG